MVIYAGTRLQTLAEVIRTELTEIAWDHQQAGEAISQFDIIYRDGAFWYRSNARVPATVPAVGYGMAQDAATSGQRLDVWIRGIISNGAWTLTSGAVMFLASGGGIVASSPEASGDIIQVVGRALTTTIMEYNPEAPILVGQ